MSNRTYFHDSVMALPPQAGSAARGLVLNAVGAAHPDEQMKLHFSLSAGNDEELAKRVAAGERINNEEIDKYDLTAADTAPLVQWLSNNGYHDVSESADHTSVFASAPATTVAQTLQVEMVRVTKDGLTCTAARNAPSLPDTIAAKVHGINGLQPYIQMNKQRANRQPHAVEAVQALLNGAPAGSTPPFLPSAILAAYHGTGSKLDGSGQTIAILIDTFPNATDLAHFWTTAGVPGKPGNIQYVQIGSGPLPPPEGEESLDVEWASGIAPGAIVKIYATGSLQFSALNKGLQRILDDAKTDPTLRQVSISLGLGELDTPTAAIRAQSQIFLRLAARGVNVFVSSGDAGSNPNSQGQSGGQLQVEYPASDPNVVGVGGTSIALNADRSIQHETAWAGSGGGKSVLFPRPVWQNGKGAPSGTARMVPDVSAVADPNTGGLIILNGKPLQYGGTSWSAPMWGGIMALMNQARVKAGHQPMAFLNPVLYKGATGELLRDVVHGSNGAYEAAIGYDMVTGLGSPIIASLKNLP